ncbi:MAG TPA: histidine kinase [Bauldia sp.]|nr:histidine kinase [Bauldia sp.]
MNSTIAHPPVELEHLLRQAGGSEKLAREVLQMFAEGTVGDFARLRQVNGAERREAAHLILGSARAIGARAVASAAAAVEAGDQNLSRLEAALAEARTFIAAYLAG